MKAISVGSQLDPLTAIHMPSYNSTCRSLGNDSDIFGLPKTFVHGGIQSKCGETSRNNSQRLRPETFPQIDIDIPSKDNLDTCGGFPKRRPLACGIMWASGCAGQYPDHESECLDSQGRGPSR